MSPVEIRAIASALSDLREPFLDRSLLVCSVGIQQIVTFIFGCTRTKAEAKMSPSRSAEEKDESNSSTIIQGARARSMLDILDASRTTIHCPDWLVLDILRIAAKLPSLENLLAMGCSAAVPVYTELGHDIHRFWADSRCINNTQPSTNASSISQYLDSRYLFLVEGGAKMTISQMVLEYRPSIFCISVDN